MKRLERKGIYEECNSIIQDQLEKGIVEPVPLIATGKVFYVPHKPVVKETAESTKLRVVYDASAKETVSQPSLNEHLTAWETKHPALVEEIKKGLYVDNVMTGGANVKEVTEKKLNTTEIFQDATFKLHKWHSNEAKLESMPQDEQANKTDVPTFAKEQFETHGA